jgi:uncharacterized protein (UPF0264 family)
MSMMLASVENLAEAHCVLESGVDIIDLKAPTKGALGALPLATVREIVTAIGGKRPVSATIGDLPMHPQQVLEAVIAMAATGVDLVKIGFFAGGDWTESLAALNTKARGFRLVAVLFADHQPDLAWVGKIAAAGFAGIMLDTENKQSGSLTVVCSNTELGEFVAEAKRHGLLCGVAGSLRQTDINQLLSLDPDYLGFRGALCRKHQRTLALDAAAVRTIRSLIP